MLLMTQLPRRAVLGIADPFGCDRQRRARMVVARRQSSPVPHEAIVRHGCPARLCGDDGNGAGADGRAWQREDHRHVGRIDLLLERDADRPGQAALGERPPERRPGPVRHRRARSRRTPAARTSRSRPAISERPRHDGHRDASAVSGPPVQFCGKKSRSAAGRRVGRCRAAAAGARAPGVRPLRRLSIAERRRPSDVPSSAARYRRRSARHRYCQLVCRLRRTATPPAARRSTRPSR